MEESNCQKENKGTFNNLFTKSFSYFGDFSQSAFFGEIKFVQTYSFFPIDKPQNYFISKSQLTCEISHLYY